MSDERIAELQEKLAARKGKGGFKKNIAFIEAEIERLKAEKGAADGSN